MKVMITTNGIRLADHIGQIVRCVQNWCRIVAVDERGRLTVSIDHPDDGAEQLIDNLSPKIFGGLKASYESESEIPLLW